MVEDCTMEGISQPSIDNDTNHRRKLDFDQAKI